MKAFKDIPWTAYFWNMARAIVVGIGTAGVSWLGTASGHAVSDKVPVLDWTSLLSILVTSILMSFFVYLQTNGLPAMKEKAEENS